MKCLEEPKEELSIFKLGKRMLMWSKLKSDTRAKGFLGINLYFSFFQNVHLGPKVRR